MTKRELIKDYYYYKNIVDALENRNSQEPKGTLRISVDKNKVRYYHCLDDYNGTQKYIHSNEMSIAKELAQKAYEEKMLKLAQKRLGQIKRLLKDFEDNEIDKLYDDLHPARKKLFLPKEKTIEQKYNDWIALEYQGKEFQEGASMILTERGERVRSKSEKIMADYFYRNNVEYKYEKPLFLKGYGYVYPDFTFFSKRIGDEVYWEHDGKMDDPEYARKAIKKIDEYENNEIYIGERLFVTFETSNKILSTREIERILKRITG